MFNMDIMEYVTMGVGIVLAVLSLINLFRNIYKLIKGDELL